MFKVTILKADAVVVQRVSATELRELEESQVYQDSRVLLEYMDRKVLRELTALRVSAGILVI